MQDDGDRHQYSLELVRADSNGEWADVRRTRDRAGQSASGAGGPRVTAADQIVHIGRSLDVGYEDKSQGKYLSPLDPDTSFRGAIEPGAMARRNGRCSPARGQRPKSREFGFSRGRPDRVRPGAVVDRRWGAVPRVVAVEDGSAVR